MSCKYMWHCSVYSHSPAGNCSIFWLVYEIKSKIIKKKESMQTGIFDIRTVYPTTHVPIAVPHLYTAQYALCLCDLWPPPAIIMTVEGGRQGGQQVKRTKQRQSESTEKSIWQEQHFNNSPLILLFYALASSQQSPRRRRTREQISIFKGWTV